MSQLSLEREAIMPRIDGIRLNIKKLRKLGETPFAEFQTGDCWDLVQHNLRLALEGVFHIGTHVLSRLPGGRAVEYSGIARRLGELNVVDRTFANEKLIPMAKLRKLLVHQYADIDPERIYHIVHDQLSDIEQFLHAIKKLLDHPEKFGLTVE